MILLLESTLSDCPQRSTQFFSFISKPVIGFDCCGVKTIKLSVYQLEYTKC